MDSSVSMGGRNIARVARHAFYKFSFSSQPCRWQALSAPRQSNKHNTHGISSALFFFERSRAKSLSTRDA